MKIFGLIGALPPTSVGAPSRPLALLRALADAGHQVELIVGSPMAAPVVAAASDAMGGPVYTARGARNVGPGTRPLRWILPLRLAVEYLTPLAHAARARAAGADVLLSFDDAGHGAVSALADRVAGVMDLPQIGGLTSSGDWARTSRERWTIQPHRSWERRVLARACALTTDDERVRYGVDRLYYRRPTVIATPLTGVTDGPNEVRPSDGGAALATILERALVRFDDLVSGRVPTPPEDAAALKHELEAVLLRARA